MKIGAALALTSDVLPSEAKSFLDHLEVEWIEEALAATGRATIRRRRLPAEQMVWLVIGMALMRNRSIVETVDKLCIALPDEKGAVAPSAIAQGRQRIGAQPIAWLFRRSAKKWTDASVDRYQWRGLRLFGVDGTKFSVPDAEANTEAFYKHTSGDGTVSSFPLVRVVAVMVLGSRICCDAEIGSFGASELEVASPLWDRIADDSLTILDRGFFYAPTLIPLAARGQNRHWLTRSRKNSRWRVIQDLGEGDQLVEVSIDSKTRKAYPDLPKVWTMRAIRWRQRKDGTWKHLVTSLVDPEMYPADELRGLYLERWEQELAYDDLKTSQLNGATVLRSRTPEGVRQELWATLIAYNLIRVEMEAIADEAGVPPRRVSFIQALRFISDEWLWLADTRSPGAIPRHLRELRENLTRLILPPRRKRPPQPRTVKPRPRKYASKKPLK